MCERERERHTHTQRGVCVSERDTEGSVREKHRGVCVCVRER